MASFGFLSKKRDSDFFSKHLACGLALLGFIFLNLIPSANIAFAAELVMFEEQGCEWCQTWNEEVGSQYKDTEIGKSVPLRRIMIDAPRSGVIKKIKNIHFTPTFVVIHGGKEVGRILGYPGESFFWGYLEKIIEKIDRHQSQQTPKTHKLIN